MYDTCFMHDVKSIYIGGFFLYKKVEDELYENMYYWRWF